MKTYDAILIHSYEYRIDESMPLEALSARHVKRSKVSSLVDDTERRHAYPSKAKQKFFKALILGHATKDGLSFCKNFL